MNIHVALAVINAIVIRENRFELEISDDVGKKIRVIAWGPFRTARLNLSGGLQVNDLHIENISARGWENVNFRILDAESECIEIYCRDIEVERV